MGSLLPHLFWHQLLCYCLLLHCLNLCDVGDSSLIYKANRLINITTLKIKLQIYISHFQVNLKSPFSALDWFNFGSYFHTAFHFYCCIIFTRASPLFFQGSIIIVCFLKLDVHKRNAIHLFHYTTHFGSFFYAWFFCSAFQQADLIIRHFVFIFCKSFCSSATSSNFKYRSVNGLVLCSDLPLFYLNVFFNSCLFCLEISF